MTGFTRHRRSRRVIATFSGFEADLLRSLASQLVELLRNPRDLRAVGVNAYRWSERTVIGLVMQTRDNSLRTSRRKGRLGGYRLTSEQGHGEPNPTYIEVGHTAMQALAARLTTDKVATFVVHRDLGQE